ncbi:SDR family NAD(P)-dependent oxidoreductase [Novosphingobium sp. AP12]|uniref:SDR family NAD(P)-dependent oxidoreductase n=1 Tax=Novosphingobium sp. AP12 TaxID=1144305 RepID=UPI0002720AA7|nr:SDR family NAD(P)-dependent oxidoreductase [Novosphingobium sp. AP12]EJL30644.1 short-chain alcohol dehydrogenase [Novosphingobium sp. AP12]
MGRPAGKRILVTGAGGDLGSAVARAYLAEGAKVVLTSRGPTRIEALAGDFDPKRAIALSSVAVRPAAGR